MAIAACAIAAPMILLANSDRIELKIGARTTKVWVDDIEDMRVLNNSEETEGFNTFKVNYKSGESASWEMDKISSMKWVKGLLPSSLELDAEVHHMCITLHTNCSDPEKGYSFGALPIEYFQGKSEHEYHEVILNYEKTLVNQFANSLDKEVKDLRPDQVFTFKGQNKITWFPSTTEEMFAMPGREYVAYIYEGDISKEDGLILDHDVAFQKVTAKTIEIRDVDYDLTYDMDCNFITGKVTTTDDEPFCLFLIPEGSMNISNPEATADTQISLLEYSIYNYGDGDWDKVTYIHEAESTSKQLCPGDSYYLMAVGCEYGVRTSTPVVSEKLTVPYPEVTDECTFTVTTEEVSASEINLNITPSDENTRYMVFMADKGTVSNPLQQYTRSIYTLCSMNQLNMEPGEGNPYVFTGAQSLSSVNNCFNGKVMMADKEYTFYLFGVNEYGNPTTAIQEINYTAKAPEEKMTFDVTFDTETFVEEQLEEQWYRMLNFKIVPSNPEMKYVLDKTRVSDRTLAMTDDEFMTDWVEGYGKYLTLHEGTKESYFNFGSDYDYDTDSRIFNPYLLFLFGYDGAATSELYMYKFDPMTGELTQLRGPGAN